MRFIKRIIILCGLMIAGYQFVYLNLISSNLLSEKNNEILLEERIIGLNTLILEKEKELANTYIYKIEENSSYDRLRQHIKEYFENDITRFRKQRDELFTMKKAKNYEVLDELLVLHTVENLEKALQEEQVAHKLGVSKLVEKIQLEIQEFLKSASELKVDVADIIIATSLGFRNKEANRLFKEVKKSKEKGYTQSEAHLSVPMIQNKVRLADLRKMKYIRENAFNKERNLQSDYYVLYTAIPHLRLFQDVMRKLYKHEVGTTPLLKNKEFQFLRYHYNSSAFDQYENVTDFLIQKMEKEGIIDDNDVDISTILVSTNLAFYGDMGLQDESTIGFLHKPQKWVNPNKKWLEECLISFGYSTEKISKLMQLNELIKKDTGDLFQIFIPKDMIDEVAYLSWRHGVPFDVHFIKKVFNRVYMTFGTYDSGAYHREIIERLHVTKKRWKENDPEVLELVNYMKTNVHNGKYQLSTFLDRYIKEPEKIPFINYYQGRLLMHNTKTLNPAGEIKIFRYCMIEKEKEKQYKMKLKQIMQEIYAEKNKIESEYKHFQT
jgi:hypothetical protein